MDNQDQTSIEMQALREELARVQAENDALKAPKKRAEPTLSFKVSDKGGVSVYGLGKFPVTLYKKQWSKLFAVIPELQTFIQANAALIADEKPAKTATVTKIGGTQAA